jgi:hypothetical protein
MPPKTFTEAMQDEEFQEGFIDWNHKQDVLQEQSEHGSAPDKGEEIGYD